jgi:long-subunit acyl-CoA synthetase (AMP-forming)
MTFLEQIFASLEHSGDAVVLQEMRDGQTVPLTARQLLSQVQVARAYLRRLRLKKADRCALLAHNSTQWVAMDLAIMAEGLTVVPLYARQAPAELVAMMKDSWPSVIACGEKSLADAVVEAWPEAPPSFVSKMCSRRDARRSTILFSRSAKKMLRRLSIPRAPRARPRV